MSDPQSLHAVTPNPSIQVRTIGDIQPLDRQFGVYPRKTVPASLRAALFAQPEPTEVELSGVGGDASRLSRMRTFAVLDACKIKNLEALLEASDLHHACLFSGKTFEECRDAAPWVVELEQDAPLTRGIFTQDASPCALWDLAPGFFLRARVPLAAMRRHLRKFTRLRDESGKWFYFRFWEAAYARPYLNRVSSDISRAAHWFSLGPSERASIFVLDRIDRSMIIFSGQTLQAEKTNIPFELDVEDRRVFGEVRMDRFAARLDVHLRNKLGSFDRLAPEDRRLWLGTIIDEAQQQGLKLEKAVADYAEAYVLLGYSPARDASIARHLHNDRHELDRARFALDEARNRGCNPPIV